MGISYKILGQIVSTTNVQQNVYVVPAATEAIISTVSICNQTASNSLYSLALMNSGDFSNGAPSKSYIVLGGVVPASDTVFLTLGLTANAQCVLAANCSTSNISIGVFGSEITP